MPGKHRRISQEEHSDPKRLRLQIEVSPALVDRLNEIVRLGESIQTWSEAIRVAIRLLEWILHRKEEGYSIQLVKDGQTREVELLW